LTQGAIVLFLFSRVKQREMAKASQVRAEVHQSGVFSLTLGKPAQMPYVCLRTVAPGRPVCRATSNRQMPPADEVSAKRAWKTDDQRLAVKLK
jgi:hypothetical protein